jgi:hypothetical protein
VKSDDDGLISQPEPDDAEEDSKNWADDENCT